MFIILGILRLLVKGGRFIYVLLSLEMVLIGILMYNLPILTEVNYMLLLIFSVSSRVLGLVMLVITITRYGHEYVKF